MLRTAWQTILTLKAIRPVQTLEAGVSCKTEYDSWCSRFICTETIVFKQRLWFSFFPSTYILNVSDNCTNIHVHTYDLSPLLETSSYWKTRVTKQLIQLTQEYCLIQKRYNQILQKQWNYEIKSKKEWGSNFTLYGRKRDGSSKDIERCRQQ